MENPRKLPEGYIDWKANYKRLKSQNFESKKETFINELLSSLLPFDSAELIITAIEESRSITGKDTKVSLINNIKRLTGDYFTQ